ncbi:hypothetical protein LINGRAHAP2_LOCUS25370 [Linum grandiflorum]
MSFTKLVQSSSASTSTATARSPS